MSDVNKDVSKSNPCIGKITLCNFLSHDFQVLFIGNCLKKMRCCALKYILFIFLFIGS